MTVRIVFCGVGALGSTAAVACRNLGATLRLVDFDRVEAKNLLAQAFVKPSIGKNKAVALKLQLANFWGITAEAFGVRLVEHNASELLGDADLVVDCFDNIASRRLVSAFARAHGKLCVHGALAADGRFGLVRWDERFVPDAEDAAGQATCEGGAHLPMITLVGAVLARAIEDFVRDGTQHDSMVSLGGVQRT